jgi:hypothetical protein
MGDRVPDSKSIWLFHEALKRDDYARRLFVKFENYLSLKGLKARKGQIMDTTVIKVPVRHNSPEENRAIKEGRAEALRARPVSEQAFPEKHRCPLGPERPREFFRI